MFVKGKDEVTAVPVYTVHTLPHGYHAIGRVSAYSGGVKAYYQYDDLADELAEKATSMGGDAVIGLIYHSVGATGLFAAGTVIQYK